jgi:putative MFS transporter
LGVPLSGQVAQIIVPASPDGWRYIFFLGGLGIFGCVIVYLWLKESPRWLVSKGRIAEAERIIEEIAPGHKVDLSKESGQPLTGKENSLKNVMIMFSKKYSRRTWVMVSLSCGITVGCFAFFAWMPTLLNEYGYSMEESLFMSALVAFGAPIGDFVAAMLADKGGRKIPTVTYCFLIGFLTILFGVLKVPALIIIVGFIIRMLVEGAFIFMWVYLAESFPTNIRNTASGLIYGTGRALTSAAMLLIPVIFTKYGYSVLFSIIGLMFIIPGIITLIWGERTAGLSLEEINEVDNVDEAASAQVVNTNA